MSEEEYVSRLREFVFDIADPKSIRKINDDLSDAVFNFAQSKSYYEEKKIQLHQYSVTQELNRNHYVVIDQDGRKIEDKKKIRKIALGHKKDIIFHYANQSLFADLLKAIQDRLILPHDPDSSLSVSIKNDSTSFELYTTKKHQLRASSVFSIRTMGEVVFGTITGTINVDVRTEQIQCKVEPFRLNMLFDDKIESVASMLATASRKGVPKKKKKSELVERIFAHPPPDMIQILDNGFKMFDSFIRSATTSSEAQAGDALASLVRRSETAAATSTMKPDVKSNEEGDGDGGDDSWGDWGDDDWGDDDE